MRMDSKGLSPAIATILLVALTVVAVGILAAFVGRTNPGTPGVSATVSLSEVQADATTITVSHSGGNDIDVADLVIRSSASTVDVPVPDGLACGPVLSAGESCSVDISAITDEITLADGDVISLVYVPSGQILATETVGLQN